MTLEKRLEFEQWYKYVKTREKETPFNFRKDFEAYCESDVLLLQAGCLKFSQLCRENSKLNSADPGFDPLVNCITFASACNTLYRRNYMPADTIATLPACGYNPKQNQSRACALWLKYVSEKRNIKSECLSLYLAKIQILT
jgi:hypothetical protein